MLRRESYATTVSLDKMSLRVRQSLLAFHFPSKASSLPSSIRSSLYNLHNHTCSWKSNHKLKAPLNFLLFRCTEMRVRLYNSMFVSTRPRLFGICECAWVFVFVSEKVIKQKQKQTIPPLLSHDIRAVVCVWANDKLSENNARSELLTHVSMCTSRDALPATDVINTLLSLTSQSLWDPHAHRCFATHDLLR